MKDLRALSSGLCVALLASLAPSCSSGPATPSTTPRTVRLPNAEDAPRRRTVRDGGWEREEVFTDDGHLAVVTERTDRETRSSFYEDSGRVERIVRQEVISRQPRRILVQVTTFSRDSTPNRRETWVEDEANPSIEVSVELDPTHTGKWVPGERYVRPRGEH